MDLRNKIGDIIGIPDVGFFNGIKRPINYDKINPSNLYLLYMYGRHE